MIKNYTTTDPVNRHRNSYLLNLVLHAGAKPVDLNDDFWRSYKLPSMNVAERQQAISDLVDGGQISIVTSWGSTRAYPMSRGAVGGAA
jgi:hypothetical protein